MGLDSTGPVSGEEVKRRRKWDTGSPSCTDPCLYHICTSDQGNFKYRRLNFRVVVWSEPLGWNGIYTPRVSHQGPSPSRSGPLNILSVQARIPPVGRTKESFGRLLRLRGPG